MKTKITDIQKDSLLLALVGLMLLSGCVKDTIYDTDHPEKAKVTITTNWSNKENDIDKPSTYVISTTNVTEEASTDTHTMATFFAPGNYTFHLYNNVSRIPVTNATAKVNEVSAPPTVEGRFIEPNPDWLFTGQLEAELEKDKEYRFQVDMHQQIRQFTLLLEPVGNMVDEITVIEGYLTNAAGELNLDSNVYGEPSNVTLAFTKITTGQNTGKWASTVRLLGITGEVQKLVSTIAFDGEFTKVALESDLSTGLWDFNNNKKIPLTLSAQVSVEYNPDVEAGFSAVISDWESVEGGTGIAY